MDAERDVVNMGYKASFSPARQSSWSEGGSNRGTCVGVLSYRQSECFREQAAEGTASTATAGLLKLPHGSSRHHFLD
eukprot:4453853-Pyramimonas_sp.AAC.1